MRLNRYLAFCGIGSRRACDKFISSGLVEVNGSTCLDFSVRIDSGKDRVKFRDKLLRVPSKHSYVILNKPVGYVCTRSDPQNRKTIYNLLSSRFKSLFYAGRLDYDSCGLVLLTNDGDLSYKLLHPSYGVSKRYFVRVSGFLSDSGVDVLLRGVVFEEGFASASDVDIVSRDGKSSSLHITMKQGMRRQVRRMFLHIGIKVIFLRREAFGSISLFPLKSGCYRELTDKEISCLRSGVTLD